MLRALLFAIKAGLVACVAIWAMQQTGYVEINWIGYNIKIHIGVAAFATVVLLLFILFLHRVFLFLGNIPKNWKKKRHSKNLHKGYQALTIGLTAIAAGDTHQADKQAEKARALLKEEKGLTLLLEAQSARLKGQDIEAREKFERLLGDKDTAFMGLRGLLITALEKDNKIKALEYGRQALLMYPKQPWILQLVYDLEVRERQWDAAESTLRRCEKQGVISAEKAKSERVAMLLYQADRLLNKNGSHEALKLLKKAYKIDGSFAPTAERLAHLYLKLDKKRSAVSTIEKTWKRAPHPDLVPVWRELAPDNTAKDDMKRLRWFEKLAVMRPDTVESQLAVAAEALKDSMWGEARKYLQQAENVSASARIYSLYAELEEKTGHEEKARGWLHKLENAQADNVWHCRETGRIYDRWSPIAEPHGAFNTIEWGLPLPVNAGFLPSLGDVKTEFIFSPDQPLLKSN